MIRAICLNPAIDRTYYIDGYVPGRPYRQIQPKVDVGGKGINAAKVCAQLGEPVACYGFIGCENGEKVLRTLKRAQRLTLLTMKKGVNRKSSSRDRMSVKRRHRRYSTSWKKG